MSESTREQARVAAELLAAEVERSFRERVPDAYFAAPRIVRRVVRSEWELIGPWVRLPHRKIVVIDRDRLLWLVALDELGADPLEKLPSRILLIARPEDDQLVTFDRNGLLLHYWRLVFHARLDARLAERTSPKSMTGAQVREQIDKLGQTQFDEVRAVLKQDLMLPQPNDLRAVFAEFVAVFFELRYFAPELVPIYFPSLDQPEQVEANLALLCQPAKLFEEIRPRELEGQNPAALPAADVSLSQTFFRPPEKEAIAQSQRRCRNWMRRADSYARQWNVVRAAMTRQKAMECAPPSEWAAVNEAINQDLKALAWRLKDALGLDETFAEQGVTLMRTVADGTAGAFWNANARLLYDLQKVCVDSERESYRVNLFRWMRTLGWQPLKQPLPNQRIVLLQKHLRTAAARLPSVKLPREARRELDALLHAALGAAERLLRERLRPLLVTNLPAAGLAPQSLVERVAFDKLVDELLDTVVSRGFLTLGNLRDAISRNQLKLPDLSGVKEFFAGDLVLQIDQRLAIALDGVYQKGPFYLRAMQRLSALGFGLPAGRFLTKHLFLPFGGAYVALEGLAHLVDPISEYSFGESWHIYSHTGVFLLGCAFWALIHSPRLRVILWDNLATTWKFIRGIAYDLPRALLRFPLVDQFLRSLPVKVFRRYLLSPIAMTLVIWGLLPYEGDWISRSEPWAAAAIFVLCFAALNSRLGRDTEELTWEWLGRAWHRFHSHVLLGLFNWIVDTFRQVMDFLERILYTVDEWLRFRTGESPLTLGVKAVLGMIWSVVEAVVRFCVTLLIEPQINPIKHFPVVTVSHKLIVPILLPLSPKLAVATGMDKGLALSVMTVISACIPGVFGFLAWELKENWKLYAANRSKTLKPSEIGHHGETVLRLLRPGFHSGTIPKLFSRRRRTARKYRLHAEFNKQAKFEEKLHHEAEAIQHFVEREVLSLLRRTKTFTGVVFSIAPVELSTNRITLRLVHSDFPEQAMEIVFAEQSGWIVAAMTEMGWLTRLSLDQMQVIRAILAGFYQLAAVDLVREQIESQLGAPAPPYDVSENGLVIWPDGSYQSEVHYSLRETPTSHPRPRSLARAVGLDPLPLSRLVFRTHEIPWEEWQALWEQEQETGKVSHRLLNQVQLLPDAFAR